MQQVYCPMYDRDLYAVFADVTDDDGMTCLTPLKLRDGESVKVSLTGISKLYFVIDTAVKGDFIVNMKIDGTPTSRCEIQKMYSSSSFVTFSNLGELFSYTPQTVLSLMPFSNASATMNKPFEVELTVTRV